MNLLSLDSMSSILPILAFLLVNVVLMLMWWIIRTERKQRQDLEHDMSIMKNVMRDMQTQFIQSHQQSQQSQQSRGDSQGGSQGVAQDNNDNNNKYPTFHGENVMAQELPESYESYDAYPSGIVHGEPQGTPIHQDIQELPVDQEDQEVNDEPEESDESDGEDEDDAEDGEDEHSDYGSEVDSLTDAEHGHRSSHYKELTAEEKISVSDIESYQLHASDNEADEADEADEGEEAQAQEAQEAPQQAPDHLERISISGSSPVPSRDQVSSEVVEVAQSPKQHPEHPELHDHTGIDLVNDDEEEDKQERQEGQETQEHSHEFETEVDQDAYKLYSKMTVKELKELAKERGFENVDRLKKRTLIMALSTKVKNE